MVDGSPQFLSKELISYYSIDTKRLLTKIHTIFKTILFRLENKLQLQTISNSKNLLPLKDSTITACSSQRETFCLSILIDSIKIHPVCKKLLLNIISKIIQKFSKPYKITFVAKTA